VKILIVLVLINVANKSAVIDKIVIKNKLIIPK